MPDTLLAFGAAHPVTGWQRQFQFDRSNCGRSHSNLVGFSGGGNVHILQNGIGLRFSSANTLRLAPCHMLL